MLNEEKDQIRWNSLWGSSLDELDIERSGESGSQQERTLD
jgi:hypothetical protein